MMARSRVTQRGKRLLGTRDRPAGQTTASHPIIRPENHRESAHRQTREWRQVATPTLGGFLGSYDSGASRTQSCTQSTQLGGHHNSISAASATNAGPAVKTFPFIVPVPLRMPRN